MRSIRLFAVLSLLAGLAYPLAVTLLASILFPQAAGGSLLRRGERIIGSALLAQGFSSPRYFWPRPSAAAYATVPSGASNAGPASSALQTAVRARAAGMRRAHSLPDQAPVPPELIFASASGLDPHLSPQAARFQAGRVARARGWTPDQEAACRRLIDRLTEPPQFGCLGQERVNVLLLNLGLDELK